MVVIKLVGGLASQFHKYAVMKSILEKKGIEFKIDLSYYDELSKSSSMQYGLPNLGINPHIANSSDIKKAKKLTYIGEMLYFFIGLVSFLPFFNKVARKILRRLEMSSVTRKFLAKSILDIHVLKSTSTEWIDIIYRNEHTYVYAEFGIRFDLIESVRNELREKITSVVLSKKAQSYLEKIKKSPKSLSLHVRRGDYISNKGEGAFFGACSKEYYKAALKSYSDESDMKIFVFSDDLDWVAKEFKGFLPFDTTYVSENQNFEDFALMTYCTYHIVANSGFSSLSAWLSCADEENITAPETWFVDEKSNEKQLSLLPKGWTYL